MSFIIDSFSYNSEVIGGAAPTHGTEVLEHYRHRLTQDSAELVFRFAVSVVSTGNQTNDFNSLNVACQAVEATLRQRYAKLQIDWGGGAVNSPEVFDPAVNQSTGFDQEPTLEKIPDFPHSGLARGYEFRIAVALPPNYTDAYGPAAGRRQVDVSFRFDVDQRLVVVVTGEWTQVGGSPGNLGRNQFLSQVDTYTAYRLSLLANAGPLQGVVSVTNGNATVIGVGTEFKRFLPGTVVWFGSQTGSSYVVSSVTDDTHLVLSAVYSGTTNSNTSMLVGQWTLTRREESDPNSLSTLRFTREYQQHVFGRRGSTVEVFFGESGQRRITIRGTYFRTISPAPTSIYGNQYGSENGSLANFSNATYGGVAYAEASVTGQLSTLTVAQGGGLTIGTDVERLMEPLVVTNEQDDRTEYTLVYRELLQKQSNAASTLDDPNIVADSMQLRASFNEQQDSTSAPLAAAIPGPDGATAKQSPPVKNPNAGIGGGVFADIPLTIQKSSQAISVQKPVDLLVSYDCFFKKGTANPRNYYENNVEPLLINLLQTVFGFQGVELVERAPRYDPTNNKFGSDLHLRAYSGNLIFFVFTLGIFNDTGIRIDPAFTGTPHEYLVQQANPRSTMSRKIEAIYMNGFSLDAFKSPQTFDGWVKVRDAQPATITKTLGIPGLGVPQTTLTYASLEENFVWVARNIAKNGEKTPTKTPKLAPAKDVTGVDPATGIPFFP